MTFGSPAVTKSWDGLELPYPIGQKIRPKYVSAFVRELIPSFYKQQLPYIGAKSPIGPCLFIPQESEPTHTVPTHYLPYIFTSCIPVAYPTISHYTILYPHCVPIVSTCGWYSWYSRAPCYSQVLVSAVASGCRAFVSWKACRRTVALPHGLLENPSSVDVGNI